MLYIILRASLINGVEADLSRWNASWVTTEKSISLVPNNLTVIILSDPLLLVVSAAARINVGSSGIVRTAYPTHARKLTSASTIFLTSFQISIPVWILSLSPLIWIFGQGTLIKMQILLLMRTADHWFILVLVVLSILASLLSWWWSSLSNLCFKIGSHIVLNSKPTIRIEGIISRSHICVSFSSIISSGSLVNLLITRLIGALIIVFIRLSTNSYR